MTEEKEDDVEEWEEPWGESTRMDETDEQMKNRKNETCHLRVLAGVQEDRESRYSGRGGGHSASHQTELG